MYTVALMNHTIDKIERLNLNGQSSRLEREVMEKIELLKGRLPEFRKIVSSYDDSDHSGTKVTLEDIVGELGHVLENIPRRRHQTWLPNHSFLRFRQTMSKLEDFRRQQQQRRRRRQQQQQQQQPVERDLPSVESGGDTSSPSDAEKDVIGRNTEKDEIIKRLLDSGGDKVISIVGIGGIGKRALATLVYNDPKVTEHFEIRSSARVSRTSSRESIAHDIVKPFLPDSGSKDTGEIMHLAGEQMVGKRWLIALDGLEGKDLLKAIHMMLTNESGLHFKLLMTTHSSFDDMSFVIKNPIRLKGLTVENAWSLLESIAFKQGQKPSEAITDIGKEIAKEICEGVPLAIEVVGSLLRNKDSLQEWLSIKENGLLKSGQKPSADVEIFFKKLKSSLDHLAPNLQLCFAYCGLLPKKHDIDLHTLIALWMAQGFINSDLGEPTDRIEDIGYDYFHQLHELSLFHDVKKDEGGSAKKCKMQNLMHDLAIYLSCNRIILMDPHGETVHERVHHIALDFNLDSSWRLPKPLLKAAHGLRTILLSPQLRLRHEVKLSTSTCHAIFTSFKRLRVLDLHDLGIKTVPDSLGKLKRLRYLDLSKNSFATLPRCTTSLRNLQTLRLSNCHMLKELPDGFNNLVNLRHLEIDGCLALTRMPLGLGSLPSLQTLSRFVASKIHNSASSTGTAGLEQLEKLNELRGNLAILHLERAKWRQSDSEAHNQFLNQKQRLQCLTLRWNRDFDDEVEGNPDEEDDERLLEILKPHGNLQALSFMGFKGNFPSGYFTPDLMLVRLSLYFCPKIESLPPLHQLPLLQIIELQRLENMKFVAKDLPDSTSNVAFFPSLKKVTLCDCPCLTSWWESGDASPVQSRGIEKLEIRYCPKLITLPFYPQELILICYGMDPLEQIMKNVAKGPSSLSDASSSSSSPVLKSLTIGKIVDSKSLPEEGLKSLTTLHRLHIQDCHKLTSIQQGIQHLWSLEDLKIENCMEINLDQEWMGLKNLRNLTIKGLPKLEALPQGLAHAESLQDLQLCGCPKLASLPKWIGKLELKSLTIEDCPTLLPRCQEGTGEDWPQIERIPKKSMKRSCYAC